jgi:hypothetical protein
MVLTLGLRKRFLLEWSGNKSTITEVTKGPIVPATKNVERGRIGGLLNRRNRSTQRKPDPIPPSPSQISRDLT